MYGKQPKKMLIMNILDILKRYTDEMRIDTVVGQGTTITMKVNI